MLSICFVLWSLAIISQTFDLDIEKHHERQIRQNTVINYGTNMTKQEVDYAIDCIDKAAQKCNQTDLSCFSQVVGIKIEEKLGKSWNVHLVGPAATKIQAAQYSKDRWMSFVRIGKPAYTYYIFKPVDCSRPFAIRGVGSEQRERWGGDVTERMKQRIRQYIQEAYTKYGQDVKRNAQYIQDKIGPGRWEIVIWDSPQFDYIDTCMYRSYFGLLLGVGDRNWGYYVGRMSLI